MRLENDLSHSGDADRTLLNPTPPIRHQRQVQPNLEIPNSRIGSRTSSKSCQEVLNANITGASLVDFAFPLLSLVNQLRNTLAQEDVAGLRSHVVREIKGFEASALRHGAQPEKIKVARYALCCLLDETVLNTPWGCNSAWSDRSLLIIFHQEAWGGEKFFQILSRLSQQPTANPDLLEFYYVCLSLGFEGKYRVQENGSSAQEQLRNDIYQIIAGQRDDFERDLSIRWEGIKDQRNTLIKYVPLWVFAAVAGALLLALYLGFNFSINRLSDPAFKALYVIGREQPYETNSANSPMAKTRFDTLRRLLAGDINQGLLELVDDKDASIIRLRSLFASASQRVKTDQLPLLDRIASALAQVEGKITVAGHTDSVPIFNARFPSNWHLSKARANLVGQVLQASANLNGLVDAEGRADNEPLAPNDSRQNRALNRRVDIIVR